MLLPISGKKVIDHLLQTSQENSISNINMIEVIITVNYREGVFTLKHSYNVKLYRHLNEQGGVCIRRA